MTQLARRRRAFERRALLRGEVLRAQLLTPGQLFEVRLRQDARPRRRRRRRAGIILVPLLVIVVGIHLVALKTRVTRVHLGEPGEYLRHALFPFVLGSRPFQGVAEVFAVKGLHAASIVRLITGKPAVSHETPRARVLGVSALTDPASHHQLSRRTLADRNRRHVGLAIPHPGRNQDGIGP